MWISTLIEVEPSVDEDHHPDCQRDHLVMDVTYTVTTEAGGKASVTTSCCMLYEMEDAAHEAVELAYERSDYGNLFGLDWDNVREAATKLAQRADRIGAGQNTRVNQEIS